MLSSLLFLLLIEPIQPSYALFASVLPAETLAQPSAHLSLVPEDAPVKKTESLGPVLKARSVYAIDLETGTPLYIDNIFERRKIASIAKLMTAMVILDHHALDETVLVSKNAAAQEGSKVWLRPGETMTVENLLTALLIPSGNDAAVALAEHHAGSEPAFVLKMNEKASELGLQNTHFSNAKGFDEKGSYSTAFDTMLFSQAALQYPFIQKVVRMKNVEVSSVNGKVTHSLQSTNELLENPYFHVVGLKTGSTPEAGESFVSFAEGPNGHHILTVILDSPNRFQETKILLDWVVRNYDFS